MKHVEHPDKLYIQLIDDGTPNMGVAFCDDEPTDKNSLDFNDFDDETRLRILHMLQTAYSFVYDRQYKHKRTTDHTDGTDK